MKELEYPVFMKDIDSSLVVCFSSAKVGHVIVVNQDMRVGHGSRKWVSADNTDHWEPYIPPLFEDGAVIWCWDDVSESPRIRRYDAKNKRPCYSNGERNCDEYSNYKLFEGELPFELPPIKD